eukprot:scaffold122425_cov36-Attheya_sp.AAC.2
MPPFVNMKPAWDAAWNVYGTEESTATTRTRFVTIVLWAWMPVPWLIWPEARFLPPKSGRLPVCLLIGGMVHDREDDNDKTSVTSTSNDNSQEELSSSASSSFSSRLPSQVQAAAAQHRTTQQNASEPSSASMKEENVVVGTTTPDVESRDSIQTTWSSSSDQDDDVKDNGKQPRLFWLDEYGSLQRLQYGTHGHAANFALSVLDQGYRSNLTREEAAELIRSCFRQMRTRYIINSPQPPCIKCVDAHGCQLIQ